MARTHAMVVALGVAGMALFAGPAYAQGHVGSQRMAIPAGTYEIPGLVYAYCLNLERPWPEARSRLTHVLPDFGSATVTQSGRTTSLAEAIGNGSLTIVGTESNKLQLAFAEAGAQGSLTVTHAVVLLEDPEDRNVDFADVEALIGQFGSVAQDEIWALGADRNATHVLPAIYGGTARPRDLHGWYPVSMETENGVERTVVVARGRSTVFFRVVHRPGQAVEIEDKRILRSAWLELPGRGELADFVASVHSSNEIAAARAIADASRAQGSPRARFAHAGRFTTGAAGDAGASVRVHVAGESVDVPATELRAFLFGAGPIPSTLRALCDRPAAEGPLVFLRSELEVTELPELVATAARGGLVPSALLVSRLRQSGLERVYLDDRPEIARRNLAALVTIARLDQITIVDEGSLDGAPSEAERVLTRSALGQLRSAGVRVATHSQLVLHQRRDDNVLLVVGQRSLDLNRLMTEVAPHAHALLGLTCGVGGEASLNSGLLAAPEAPTVIGYFPYLIDQAAVRVVVRNLPEAFRALRPGGPPTLVDLLHKAVDLALQDPRNAGIREHLLPLLGLIPQISSAEPPRWRSAHA